MKLLLPVLALFSFGQAWRDDTKEEVKAVFDKLLAEDSIVLKGDLYETRFDVFSIGYLAGDVGDAVSLELMYTIQELLKQNGARLVDGLKTDKTLQKREEGVLLEKRSRTPPVYDGRKKNGEVIINDVVNQQSCGNCYLHTFVAALELAYTKATGEVVKFSEQEMTDCYNNGCEGGDYRMVAITMSYLDKLSTISSYVTGGYLNGQYTCRADTTPDALDKIKVVDYIEVTTENIEAAIVNYGSVMTCMKWSTVPGTDCYMTKYTEGVVDYPEVPNGCDHAVLIVGYTPGFYIVRNSHGHSWGEKGYFRIKRNKNVCGIEEQMAAIIVVPRGSRKVHRKNGCPPDKPFLCGEINTCTARRRCVKPKKKRERLVARKERVLEKKRDTADALKEYKRSISEGEEIEIEKRCADTILSCPLMKSRGVCENPNLARFCPSTCGQCGKKEEKEEEIVIPDESSEREGKCYKPKITDGVAMHRGSKINPGQELVVQCMPGYTLVGDEVKCLIQNVFANAITKDARLLPECIKLGNDTLVGNGKTYFGTKNTFTDKIGRELECDSWNEDVLRGVITYEKDAMKYMIGNHNYCRNPGGEQPVPFCLSSAGGTGKLAYCFTYPGCDVCAGASDNYGKDYCIPYAARGKCDYTDVNSKAQISFFWDVCKATCCARAGCKLV